MDIFSSSYANRHLEWVRKTKYRPESFAGMIDETN